MGDDGQEAPKIGAYRGTTKDFSCPGDNVTWEILLLGGNQAALECIPEMNYFKGGQPPWRCEGTWEFDADDMEVVVSITKQDAIGPRKDSDIKIPVSEDWALTFKGAKCVWKEAPPTPNQSKLAAMSLKELKAALVAIGVDPVGCLERADFEAKLLRFGLPKDTPVKEEAAAAAAPAADAKAAAQPAPAATAEPAAAPAETSQAAVIPASAAAAPAAAAVPAAAPAAEAVPAAPAEEPQDEGVTYTLEQLTDKKIWEKLEGVSAGERETYLPDKVFQELFGKTKADFAKLPKWKKDGEKKKHGLF